MDNFIQITVFCPPEPRIGAFVYRNAGKVYSHNVHKHFQSERWWNFQGYYCLFPNCRFQYCCRPLGCPQLHCHSQKLSLLPLYLMNFPHWSRSLKYFLHFGSLLFLSNHIGPFCQFLIRPLSTPTSASPSRNVFNHDVWSSQRFVVVAHTQLARRCLSRELCFYFEVTVRG